MKINKEKFLEALDQLENHQKNQANSNLEEAKEALENIIRRVELSLCNSNSEFTEISSGINFQDIFDEIEEFSSQEEIEAKEKEFFSTFFTLYFTSLKENIGFIENKEEAERLVSVLEIFQERKTFPLLIIYEGNKETIEDTIQIIEAVKLSFGESKEEVVAGSSKTLRGKEKEENFFTIEPSKQNFLVDAALKKVNKDNIIELQKQIIKEKDEVIEEQKKELEKLNQELTAEREKNTQLKLELGSLQAEKLESKVEVPPKK